MKDNTFEGKKVIIEGSNPVSNPPIVSDMILRLREHLNNMTPEEMEETREFFRDKKPKGWLSIEEYIPMMFASDIEQGYSVFRVKDIEGNEFDTPVSDGNTWYYWAKEQDIVEWFNK